MNYEGNLRKMRTQYISEQEVQYFMPEVDGEWCVNDYIGKEISYSFDGRINCVACGKKTKKAFGQGFCYPCFRDSPLNSECIIRPELCEAHLGKGRDPEWERKNHLQPHVVYLALSSGVKVGVTRHDQVPTRWIDQGASEAIVLAITEYRRQAGEIEVALKKYVTDKTNWQRMLKNQVSTQDLSEVKQLLRNHLPEELGQWVVEENNKLEITYPVLKYPEKVKSIKLDKLPTYSNVLEGIKGQYLIFEGGNVFNVRSHAGYYTHWHL